MKTIREWLEELPEPYRTQAIENTEDELLLERVESLKKAVKCAFIWNKSPQGHEYWSELHETLND